MWSNRARCTRMVASMSITYSPAKQPGMFVATDYNGNACGFVSEESMNNEIGNRKVYIRHWCQDTVEAGHWSETGVMTNAEARSLFDYLASTGQRPEIVEVEE
mgnify:CR=1 FL=1